MDLILDNLSGRDGGRTNRFRRERKNQVGEQHDYTIVNKRRFVEEILDGSCWIPEFYGDRALNALMKQFLVSLLDVVNHLAVYIVHDPIHQPLPDSCRCVHSFLLFLINYIC
jgi:hypothetical protein